LHRDLPPIEDGASRAHTEPTGGRSLSPALPALAGIQAGCLTKPPRYCWSTPFNILGVLFLEEVCSAFWPSKKACWAHQLRYLGDGQQYPPVFSTSRRLPLQGQPACRTTHYNNLCSLDPSPAYFSTPRSLPA